jgi:hypothetical protein
VKRTLRLTAWLAVAGTCCASASGIRFGVDGRASELQLGTNAQNRVDAQNPGRGFIIRTFTGAATEDTPLKSVSVSGEQLVAAGERGLPRLTFDLARGERYVALKLKRVEGLPAASLAALHIEVVAKDKGVRILPLDYMTRSEQRGSALSAQFCHLWHRHAGDPLGGFALYAADTDAESDEALLEVWCSENLPKPALGEPWTRARARRWLDDYHAKFMDMTTMILGAGSEAELYALTDLAASKGVKMIYLHTDTWRGEYWPKERTHVHVNEAVFPKGRADLKRYAANLDSRGMNLALHYTCGGIGPSDPQRIAGHVSRDLASWCKGRLAEAAGPEARDLKLQPAPGSDIPFAAGPFGNGPGLRGHFFETGFVRVDDEIVRVGTFEDLDKPVWTLRGCQRAYGATAAAAHAAGAEAAGLLSAYGQNFVPDNDSPLLDEVAREFAAFANEIGLDQLEYDAYEIHRSTPWGPQKFSDAVARHLDHPVISNTSGGRPVASNIELLFSRIRDINQFGYHTVNLSLQLDGHRPATSALDAGFELSSLVAKGVRRFQILKPEPMFGVSTNILTTHGLADELFGAFNLWREVTPLLSEENLKAMRANLAPFGNHMQGKDLFQVRKSAGRYELIPTRVMLRRQGDVPWKVGQEFGPVGPRQLGRPGDVFVLENPYAAQPARFVIRVLAELSGASASPAAGSSVRAGDALVDSYRSGADAAGKAEPAAGGSRATQAAALQPLAKEIANQRLAQFAQDGETLLMTAENPRAEAVRLEEGLPSWRREFSMASGRGIAMDIEGDGSGALVLLQLHGRGVRDYVVKVDFKGPRSIMIPSGEASWADGNWGWRFGAKHFDYDRVAGVSLGFGEIPAKTNPKVRISRLRALVDAPSKLVSPVIRTGAGALRVEGEIESGCYLRYDNGDIATVYDRNWRKLRELPVVRTDYVMPSGFAPVSVTVAAGAPLPWLELQAIVEGEPIRVPTPR